MLKLLMNLKDRRRGSAMMLFTLLLPCILLPIVGLAIDGVRIYTVKAKLVSAVDGGAIAAARSLNVGMSFDSQKATAAKTAGEFVAANFPAHFWNARNLTLDPPVDVREDTETAYKRRTVAITAGVEVPLLFMPILGVRTATVRAYSMAARRDVRLVLVLDKSASMNGAPMTALKTAAADFVSKFAEGRDQLGLVVFGDSAIVAFPAFDPANGTGPTSNFKSANPSIGTLVGSLQAGNMNTGMADGLWLAYQELLKHPLEGALNLIVLFTDGMPNGISATFNKSPNSVMKSSPCTYYSTTDSTKYITGSLSNGYGILQLMNAATTAHPTATSWLSFTGMEPIVANPPSKNCTFYTKNDATKITSDLAKLPSQDMYGNATNGTGYRYSRAYIDGGGVGLNLNTVNTYQMGLIGWNAVDAAAKRIRDDATLNPIIYTIGLEGSNGADAALMKRMSNVNDSTNMAYDSGRPAGKYFPAPSLSYIQLAFAQVAAEILRLTN
jgi:Flp pilus assembly protein TadG